MDRVARREQVGTVVELLDGAYEVEFIDDEAKTYAELARPAPGLRRPQWTFMKTADPDFPAPAAIGVHCFKLEGLAVARP